MRMERGFTLIELMITVAIVAILAAIAIPNYSDYVRRSQRTEAKSALQQVLAAEEKYFLANGSYTTAMNNLSGTGLKNVTATTGDSENGHYTVRVFQDATEGWYIRAVAASTSQQADTDCRFLKLYFNGSKSATSATSGAPATTDTCW